LELNQLPQRIKSHYLEETAGANFQSGLLAEILAHPVEPQAGSLVRALERRDPVETPAMVLDQETLEEAAANWEFPAR
jgi:hypothetical protein